MGSEPTSCSREREYFDTRSVHAPQELAPMFFGITGQPFIIGMMMSSSPNETPDTNSAHRSFLSSLPMQIEAAHTASFVPHAIFNHMARLGIRMGIVPAACSPLGCLRDSEHSSSWDRMSSHTGRALGKSRRESKVRRPPSSNEKNSYDNHAVHVV